MNDRSRCPRRASLLRALAIIAIPTLIASACVRHTEAGALYDSSLITEDEIDSAHAVTALEAVRKLRPMFLTSRGKLEFGTENALPNVYVDNQYYGDVSTLRGISAATIETIKFYSASEAQFKFGRGNAAGVIGIFTKH
jgi:hypothetical protein